MRKLKYLRTSKKLTQQELANTLGITRSTYSKYENGIHQPSPALLQKFADFFSVSIDYLLDHTPESESMNMPYSLEERDMIEKYRRLDQRGKCTVSDTLDREYNYIKRSELKLWQDF